jgi:hypothetical protein
MCGKMRSGASQFLYIQQSATIDVSDAETRMEEPADARRVPSPLNGEKVAEGRMRGGNAQDSDSRQDCDCVASVITPHPALSPLRGEEHSQRARSMSTFRK